MRLVGQEAKLVRGLLPRQCDNARGTEPQRRPASVISRRRVGDALRLLIAPTADMGTSRASQPWLSRARPSNARQIKPLDRLLAGVQAVTEIVE